MEYADNNKLNESNSEVGNQEQSFSSIPPKNSNRNLKILVGVLIVLLVIGVGVASFYIFGNKTVPKNELTKPKVSNQITPSQQKNDTILFSRSNGIYEINILTKELKPSTNPADGIIQFIGLPKEVKNKQTSISLTRTLVSQDKTKAIVVFTTFDETQKPSEFNGSLPTLKADEFICDIATQKCSTTDSLASAYKATGLAGKWFGGGMLWWYKWDSVKNLFYGHLSGEGIGNASPVYVFNLNNKSLQQTTGYNSLDEKEKRAGVPAGAFSPSLNRFVMVESNNNKWDLLLYESNNLSAPLKKYDVSSMNDTAYNGSGIDSVVWSADEKTLVLETNKQIFTLNLENGEIALKYTDTTQDESGLWLDFNAVDLSPSGRYIVFVDYDKRKTLYSENKLETVLKAIDLKDNNNVIELLHEEGLSLYYQQ